MHFRSSRPGQLTEIAKQLVDISLTPGANVNGARVVGLQCDQVGASHIANKDIVSRLLAITVDDRLLASQQSEGENSHHTRLAMGVLARSVDIGIAQRNVRNTIFNIIE